MRYVGGGASSALSVVMAVPAAEAWGGFSVVVDAFWGLSAPVLFKPWTDGFLKRPVAEGFLVGRKATGFEPDFGMTASFVGFSGLGVLVLGMDNDPGWGRP